MRILILAPRLPWPPTDGGRVAMSRLAEGLAHAGADVEVLSLNPRKHHGDPSLAPLPTTAIDIDTSRPALHIVRRFVSRAYRDALRATLARFRPDVVQVESPFLLPYVEAVRAESRAKIALRSLNVEFRIWDGLARHERNPLRRLALRWIARSLRQYEVRHLDTCDAIVPITAADADDFRALGCTRPMHVVPCGVVPSLWMPPPSDARVAFIGSLDFRPNQDAALWIVDELWPRVVPLEPDAQLLIAGSSPPDWLRRRIALSDFDDAQRASIVLAPLFAGGGMRIKVLEAMAMGKAVVATSLGAGGIDVTPAHDVLIADDVACFADAVVRLLREPESVARLGAAARATVAAKYDNDALARGLMRFYETGMSSRA